MDAHKACSVRILKEGAVFQYTRLLSRIFWSSCYLISLFEDVSTARESCWTMGESKFPTAFKLTVRVRDLFPKISWSSQLWYLTSNGICFKPRISASWPSLLNWSNCMKGICFEPMITALVFLYECISLIEVNAKKDPFQANGYFWPSLIALWKLEGNRFEPKL